MSPLRTPLFQCQPLRIELKRDGGMLSQVEYCLVHLTNQTRDESRLVVRRLPSIKCHVPGDASEMYKGALMDAILTPRPTKTLPIARRSGLGAEALRIFQQERGNQQ
ncbi:Hypothetical predicted protein [Olea europaea subsp. europaea]|uniref:Uncharacterized protein n=1 Tax=Olea europaea subsp. europaea TaxID=158383 RepID=A0A8S0PVZ2_OLEEU|nr:Hypothetical predicted protein [Olea europaea subsp. europaea]